MRWRERLAWLLIAAVTLTGAFAACQSVGEPQNEREAEQILNETDPALVSQYQQRIQELEAAIAALDLAQGTPEPEDDAVASEAVQAAEARVKALEDELAASRGGSVGRAIGGTLGSIAPGFGPLGGAVGWIAGIEAAKMLLTTRGRRLLRQAARALGPDAPGAEGSLALVDALRAILASVGWGHSSEASEAAAEVTVGKPKPVRETVAKVVREAVPADDAFIVAPVGTPPTTVESRRVAETVRPE